MELHSSGSRSLASACRRAAVVQEAFFRLQASYPARHRNSRPDAPRVTGNGHPPRVATVVALALQARDEVAEKVRAASPAVHGGAGNARRPSLTERGLVEMPCGFCLDDKAEPRRE